MLRADLPGWCPRARVCARVPRVVALGSLLLLLAPGGLAAQASSSQLSGQVLSETAGTPLANAQVVIMGTEFRALTDRSGRFELRGIPVGERAVEVSVLGHQTLQFEIDFEEETVHRVDVRLAVAAVELEGVEVEAEAARPVLSPHMQAFYDRRERGSGYYFTHDQLDRMQLRAVTDVLARVPGASIRSVPGPFGNSEVVQIGRTTGMQAGGNCNAVYYVNGMPFPVPTHIGINAYVRPQDVEAMEVYSGASRIPAQFNNAAQSSRCGVVVIWTRDGPIRR